MITFKSNVSPNNFTWHDVTGVNSHGVSVVNVRPAGKRDVVVTVRGLHPNTKDEGVKNYLSKFGKITSNRVVHCTFSEGPLKGLKNGDRSYQLEIKPGTNIPSYQVLYGQTVTLRYGGQKKTCGRCFKLANMRMGGWHCQVM